MNILKQFMLLSDLCGLGVLREIFRVRGFEFTPPAN